MPRCWQWGGCRSGLCEGGPGVAQCPTQPVPASAATAPPQGTAEPVGQAGGTALGTHLRKGKTATKVERTERQKVRNSNTNGKVRTGEGGGSAPGTGADTRTAAHRGDRGGAGVPLQPVKRPHQSRYLHCSPRRTPTLEQGDVPCRTL